MEKPKGHTIRSQLTCLSLISVLVAVSLCLLGTIYLTLREKQDAIDQNLINNATILSHTPLVKNTFTLGQASSETISFLDTVIQNTSGVDLILLADSHNTLLYAPTHSLIGSSYVGSVQQQALLRASPYTSDDTGLTGMEHAAYAPVFDSTGAVSGFVMVGIYAHNMMDLAMDASIRMIFIGVLAALVGFFLALRLSERIKRTLMGYEPEALKQHYLQRDDILEALEEGILAIDKTAHITYLNRSAAQMLSLDYDHALGAPLHTIYPNSTLNLILKHKRSEYNVAIKSLSNVQILADRLPLYEHGSLVGAVSIFRNRTEVTKLAEDLTGVQHMVDAMRAYTHEFMNKLHVILGLLEVGDTQRAQEYIMDTTRTQQDAIGRIIHQIKSPSVAALLVGKTSRANELGIHLTLDRESTLSETHDWIPSDVYITILGNLIENAIENLNRPNCPTKEITISIFEQPDSILLCVEDTGTGIPPEYRKHLFQCGVSTKGKNRGTGLSLVADLVETYHGQIRVESECGVGSAFLVTFQKSNDSTKMKQE